MPVNISLHKSPPKAYNQSMFEISAGAIVHTKIQGQILYLIIKDFHGNFGFPKGHLEKGETEEEAAIREIKEETGIDIELDPSFREELRYIMPNGIEKRSVYYLGSYKDQDPHRQLEEVEKIFLLPYADAMQILTFDNMKEVLAKANSRLKGNSL